MSSIGQRLARAEKAIWGDMDPDKKFPPFGAPRGWGDARCRVRELRIAEACAVLGVSDEDARMLEQHFDKRELRRAKLFLDHCRIVLTERERASVRRAAA